MTNPIKAVFFLLFIFSGSTYAQFSGEPAFIWKTDETSPDRDMELVNEFSYTDPEGKVWSAPSGAIVDGASIPRVFWRIIGPPFVGDYRRASVIHDYYCDTEKEAWQDVHRMFYEAVLDGGVSTARAKLMYAAVYHGGPRWSPPGSLGAAVEQPEELTEGQLSELELWLEDGDRTLFEIETKEL